MHRQLDVGRKRTSVSSIRARRLYERVQPVLSGPERRIRNAGAPVFLVELWSVHSTNWRFFLRGSRGPTARVVHRGPRGHEKESFIDEIVNTADRWMFCRPIGRLSVAIGDHPMRLVRLRPRQKGTQLGRRTSLSHGSFKCCFVPATRETNYSSASRILGNRADRR